jgi:hypothetical protein
VSRKEPSYLAARGALLDTQKHHVKHARTTIFFIHFVDRMFTNLFERPFTKVFDALAQSSANSCVYRGCHAD